MTYEQFASDLPQRGRVTFRSAEENEEVMQQLGVNQRMRQLGRGRFQADLAVAETTEGELFADRFNRACSMHLECPAGSIGFVVLRSANRPFRVSGHDAPDGSLMIFPSEEGADLLVPDLGGSESVTVPVDRLINAMEVLCPAHQPIPLDRMTLILSDTLRLRRLRRGILALLGDPDSRPASQQEEVSNLIMAIVVWATRSARAERRETILVNGACSRVAKRAQEFIEEHYATVVRIEDLCRFTGAGVRTLQRCFRQHFDLTISDYLKTVRLDATQRELAAGQPETLSVTHVALDSGFTHFGRFSVEYRSRFGESPRETLRRGNFNR